MTEKINIKGRDAWIVIDPHITPMAGDEQHEYFTASYHALDPATDPAGTMFMDTEHKPLAFRSPAEALDYAREKLLGMY